jgi:hypothetical protein
VNTSLDALARMIAQGIEAAAREAARDEARRTALEVLDRAGARRPAVEWVSQVEAARIAGGVTTQTIREWLRTGDLGEPGKRGRVNVERLRAYLAGKTPGEPTTEGRGRKIAAAALAVAGGGRR